DLGHEPPQGAGLAAGLAGGGHRHGHQDAVAVEPARRDVAAAVPVDVDVGEQETLADGDAGKVDRGQVTDRAVRAVAADHPVGVQSGAVEVRGHAVVVDLQSVEGTVPLDLDAQGAQSAP